MAHNGTMPALSDDKLGTANRAKVTLACLVGHYSLPRSSLNGLLYYSLSQLERQ